MENLKQILHLASKFDSDGSYDLADIEDEKLENNVRKHEYKRNTESKIKVVYHLIKMLFDEYGKFDYERKLSNSDKKIVNAFIKYVEKYESYKKSSDMTEADLQQELLPEIRFLLKNKDYDFYPDNYSSYIFEKVIENLEVLASHLVIQMELDV